MKLSVVSLITIASIVFSGISHSENERPEKPNIVVILTDDLGWQDVDCYDIDEKNAYFTPRIDALAAMGVKFMRAYSPAPTCAPSRCAIVSGVHPARAQKTHIKGGTPPSPVSKKSRMMSPWYSARTPVGDYTLASALKDFGYTTGHVGKWHMSYSEPKAMDLGFDVSYGSRVSKAKMGNRLKDFATTDENDPYKIDENGFSFNQTTENALTFIKDHQSKPFFLYYATWLVHAPIQTRSESLLNKYAEQMGIDPADRESFAGDVEGQKNPFYAAMVEELDYNIGRVIDYLENTDDPRWLEHKLIENTYIIFTSDNGGTEGKAYERYTDNNPLDLGKTSVKEGGIRVPLIVTGPNIKGGLESNVLVNGLDIYPTALSLAGAEAPDKKLDGLDLSKLLLENPTDSALVVEDSGKVRNKMVWHFPHDAFESAIILGDYKLIKNYDYIKNPEKDQFELYRLYKSNGSNFTRVDLEESKNLAEELPGLVLSMNRKLESELNGMRASYPHFSPHFEGDLPHKEKVVKVVGHSIDGNVLSVTLQENGAKVQSARIIYSVQGKSVGYQEWFPAEMLISGDVAIGEIPKGAKYIFVNLVDENNYLVSYPDLDPKLKKGKTVYSDKAIQIKP